MEIDWTVEALGFFEGILTLDEEADFQTICEQTASLLKRHSHADAVALLQQKDHVTVQHLAGLPDSFLSDTNIGGWLSERIDKDIIQFSEPLDDQCQISLPVVNDDFKGAFFMMVPIAFRADDGFVKFIQKLWPVLKKTIRLGHINSSIFELRTRFNAIMETIPQGVVYIDNSGISAWTNTQGAKFLKLSQQTIEPLKISTAMQKLRDEAINSEDILSKGNELFTNPNQSIQDWNWIFDKPTQYVLSVTSTPLKSSMTDGRLWIFTDVTEKYLADKTLNRLNIELIEQREQAVQANQAKSDFLSSMSHELRTPMNAILGFSQLMQFDDTLSTKNKKNVKEILKAGHHLLELINDILDLSTIESGKVNLSLEPVKLLPVIEECLWLVATLADKKGIRISKPELISVSVCADKTRLKQALLNLLSNAIKYNHDGGTVKIDIQETNSVHLRILVTDSGKGIPPERMQELFQPFSRLGAESSNIEGTGVGLTITRRIVEMMDGSVGVKSEPGVGSTFWIELPIESINDFPHAQEEADIISTPALDTDEKQQTVLYIEDNASNLKLVAQLLIRRKNINLLTAHTPELGIELAITRIPDLILLDINLPGMNGLQVLKIIKSEKNLQNIPIIAVTANAMSHDIEQGMAAGFVEYLIKPLDVNHFYAVLDKLLGSNHHSSAQ